jgi:phage N-6-adenine-methyltransferase
LQGEDALFSSASVEWGTPPFLFRWLDETYHFALDPCASKFNHKCSSYFTKEENGLTRNWSVIGRSAFMNPPYNKPEAKCKPNCTTQRCIKRGYHNTEYVPGIGDWMKKAHHEAGNGMDVICLVPNRSDTGWYKNYAMKADIIYNIGGRIHFTDYSNPEKKLAPSTFPSIIVCFHGTGWNETVRPGRPKLYYIDIDRKTNQIIVL